MRQTVARQLSLLFLVTFGVAQFMQPLAVLATSRDDGFAQRPRASLAHTLDEDRTETPTLTPSVEIPNPAPTPPEASTSSPTDAPTTPTDAPTTSTDAPSDVPTQTPTDAPTQTPTDAPTTPTDAPTQTPTDAPIDAPTQTPTDAPTQVPTEVPTQTPSITPVPTEALAETPLDAPSATPSPTEALAETPLDAPSATPSPTNAPTEIPTATPTQTPSATPSPSDEPDEEPTAVVAEEPVTTQHKLFLAVVARPTTDRLTESNQTSAAPQSGTSTDFNDLASRCSNILVGRPAIAGPFLYTSAFEQAYDNAGGESVLGCPSGSVNDQNSPPIQRFDNGNALIYNQARGTAFYLAPDYLKGYEQAINKGITLGAPTENSGEAGPAPDYYLDDSNNFIGQKIQYFQYGFVGPNNGTNWTGAYFWPIVCPVNATLDQFVEYPQSPDPNVVLEGTRWVTLTVTIKGIPAPGAPSGNNVAFNAANLLIFGNDTEVHNASMQIDGDGFKALYTTQFPETTPLPTYTFFVAATRSGDDFTGYSPQHAKLGDLEGIPGSWGCDGLNFSPGSFSPPRDTTPPVIDTPSTMQDGFGGLEVRAKITDNVRVADAQLNVDGTDYPMQSLGSDIYAATVQGLSVGNHAIFLTARDTSTNTARWPATGVLVIKIEYSGVYGKCDWIGYSPDPVNTLIGNFIYEYLDTKLIEPGPDLELRRFYNSQSSNLGRFGLGWSTLLDMRVATFDTLLLKGAQVRYPDGRTVNFPANDNGFDKAPFTRDRLEPDGNGFLLTSEDRTRYRFDDQGRLTRIEDESNNAIMIAYNGNAVASITSAAGRLLTVTSDPNGRITAITGSGGVNLSYQYDGDGRLLSATDSTGGTATYTYDPAHGMTKLTTPLGADFMAEQRYDDKGRVIYQRVGENFINEFTYDDAHRTTLLTDTYGNTITYRYDEKNRLVEQEDALGGIEQFAYNDDNQRTSYTNRNNRTTKYEYDDQGNRTKQIDALGGIREWTYRADRNLLQEKDPLGRLTSYEYDAQGRRSAIIDPLNGRISLRYDTQGHLIEQMSPRRGSTRYEYDAQGNLISETNALNHTTRYQYNERGLRIQRTDALGGVTRWAYDANGNLLSETDPTGATRSYTYDKNNNRISETDALGNTTRYTYNRLGKLTHTLYPDGGEATITYDDMGNSIAETDALKRTTRYERDELYRVIKEIAPDGTITSYEYDAESNRMSVTDQLKRTTRTEYDALERVVTQTNALGDSTRYAYDAVGNRLSEQLPNGATTRYEYDKLNRLVKQIDAMNAATRFAYDAEGNRTSVTDALGGVTRFEYDLLNHLVAMTDASGSTTRTSYDALGRPVAVTDALGFTSRTAYDAAGRVVAVTDALGGLTRTAYDANSNLIAVTDARGHTTTTRYDAMNRAVAVQDALGAITTVDYDLGGQRIKTTDANHNSTTFEYDLLGRTVAITDALNIVLRSTYDAVGNLRATTDQAGAITRFEYDPLNRKVRETNPLGAVTRFEYDKVSNLLSTIDANGAITRYQYDLLGRKTAVIDAFAAITRYSYDALGRLTRTTFADGSTSTATYDIVGRKLSETNGEGQTRRFAYDAVGNQLSASDARGNLTITRYDALRRPVEVRDSIGPVQSFAYDAASNLVASTDGNGATTRQSYDALGRKVAVTDPEGNTVRMRYDAVGNLTAEVDGNGKTTAHAYNQRNERVATTDANGNITRTNYDSVGRKSSVIDPLGIVTMHNYSATGLLLRVTQNYSSVALPANDVNVATIYRYDAVGNRITTISPNRAVVGFSPDLLGRLVAEADALGNQTNYRYDAVGRQVERQEPNGTRVQTTYDRAGRPLVIRYSDGTNEQRRYDADGNLIELRDRTGVTTFAYDARGRLLRETSSRGTVAYAYDNANNRVAITYPDGRVQQSTYYKNTWLKEIINPDGSQTSHEYDGAGRLVRQTNGNNTVIEQQYDAVGNLLRTETRRVGGGNQLVALVSYRYNAANQRIEASFEQHAGTKRVTETYEQDRLYRLVLMRDSKGVETRYSYDAAGNRTGWAGNDDPRTSKPFDPFEYAYSYDPADQLVRAEERVDKEVTTYGYDANGNRVERQAGREALLYRYDAHSKLIEVEEFQINGNGKWNTRDLTTMDYDGLGRRVVKTEDHNADGDNVKTRSYSYAGLDPIAYTEQWNHQQTNLYRDNGGQIVAQERFTSERNGKQTWLTHDALGNTIATSGENGQASASYRYDPYGLPDAQARESDNQVVYLFTGQEYDQSTGLYHFHARHYDPETGTWLTRDPYRGTPDDPQSLHRYGYVKGNPINLWDALGYAAQGGTYGKQKSEPDPLVKLMFGTQFQQSKEIKFNITDAMKKLLGGISLPSSVDKTVKDKLPLEFEFVIGYSSGKSNRIIPQDLQLEQCVSVEPYFKLAVEFEYPIAEAGILSLTAGLGGEAGMNGRLETCIETDVDIFPLEISRVRSVQASINAFGNIRAFLRGKVDAIVASTQIEAGLRASFERTLLECKHTFNGSNFSFRDNCSIDSKLSLGIDIYANIETSVGIGFVQRSQSDEWSSQIFGAEVAIPSFLDLLMRL